jgi:death-on-curing protein
MKKLDHWMTREECLALHDMMLAHYGGTTGLRDAGLLESALARPRQLLAYGKPAMPELAAAYVAGIVRNHPFVDGNKRTGFMLGAGFLERNGWEFMADEADAVIQTLALAANAITQEPYASWLGSNSRRRKG